MFLQSVRGRRKKYYPQTIDKNDKLVERCPIYTFFTSLHAFKRQSWIHCRMYLKWLKLFFFLCLLFNKPIKDIPVWPVDRNYSVMNTSEFWKVLQKRYRRFKSIIIQDWEKLVTRCAGTFLKPVRCLCWTLLKNRSFWNNANTFTFRQRLATHTELELAPLHPFVCTKHRAGVGRGG